MDFAEINAKEKILSVMREKNTKILKINRNYLPEFISYSLLDFDNSKDGLPILNLRFNKFLLTWGIIVEYKEILIIFNWIFDKSKIHKEKVEGLKGIHEMIPEEFLISPLPPKIPNQRVTRLKNQLKKIRTHLMRYDDLNPDLFEINMDIGKLEALGEQIYDLGDEFILMEYKWKKYYEKLIE
jgi:hypothetical protein